MKGVFIWINFFGGSDFGDSISMEMVLFETESVIGLSSLKGPLLLPVFYGLMFIGLVFIESAFVRSSMYDSNKFTPFS